MKSKDYRSLESVFQTYLCQWLTSYIFTLDENYQTTVYYPALQTEVDQILEQGLCADVNVITRQLVELPSDAAVTHVDLTGAVDAMNAVTQRVEDEPHLVTYFGLAMEGSQWHWLDIHRRTASNGVIITTLK